MQKLANFVPAASHKFKPLLRDGSQFTRMAFQPRIYGGSAFDSAIESQQFRRFHAFEFIINSSTCVAGVRLGR